MSLLKCARNNAAVIFCINLQEWNANDDPWMTVNPRTEFSKSGNLEIPGNPEIRKSIGNGKSGSIGFIGMILDFSRFPIPEFQWNSIGIDFL
jgi:hypothetical protein